MIKVKRDENNKISKIRVGISTPVAFLIIVVLLLIVSLLKG